MSASESVCVFFVFKQKTAYEMRIRDWSSDVCSSDLLELGARRREQLLGDADVVVHRAADIEQQQHLHLVVAFRHHADVEPAGIGGGRLDGVGQVELETGALAGDLAQAAPCRSEESSVGTERIRTCKFRWSRV